MHKGKLVRLQNSVGEFKKDNELTQQSFDAFMDRCLDGDCGSYFDEGQKDKPSDESPPKQPPLFESIGDVYKREHGINKLHGKRAQWK